MNEDIKVTFIIPNGCENENSCSEEMQLAFVACEQHCNGGLQATWAHEAMYNKFDNLTKRDVFVLSEFGGELYDKLKSTKCLLVGPRCLSCCLVEGTPIPSGPEPVFTIAMKGLSITASGLTKQKKEGIKKKIHWMGGLYTTVLTDDTTHLVSDTVLSDKYIKAVEKGIPVMSESWIEAVWEASLGMNVNGASADFKCHKLPAFANLQVTTSGITKKDKMMIMKLVNEGGGVYSGAFQSETTDVVVLTRENVGSEKYKAAIEFGKACVLPNWVKDSSSMGVALPFAKYRVTGASTSSPLAGCTRLPDMNDTIEFGKACVLPNWVKDSSSMGVALPFAKYRVTGASTSSPLAGCTRLPDMSLNFSRITCSRPPSNFVEESRVTDMSTVSTKMKLTQDTRRNDSSQMDRETIAAFENFDMSSVKKAGPIFDGFCIWLTGLDGIARDRASSLISRTGGVRYESAHERVTHIVAGNRASGVAASRALGSVPVLSTRWLLDSVTAAVARPEQEYLLDTNPTTPAKSARKPKLETASPMSKRNLQLLRRSPLELPPPTPAPPALREEQDELVNHYLSQNMPDPDPLELQRDKTLTTTSNKTNATLQPQPDFTATIDDPTEEIDQIFRGIKIEVVGLDEEAICEIAAEVAAAGGALVAAGGGGERVLVPLEFDAHELQGQGEPVTVFWLKDCLSQQELLPIQYYHRPVRLPLRPAAGDGALPLAGVVASLSTYSGFERAFLDELAKLLGATTQLRFCRRNTANALASTHLICPTPSGDKYLGAVKWGLPAVRASWLMECAETGVRVSEEKHLVGDTKAPQPPAPPSPQKQSPKPKADEPNEQLDKENNMLPPAHSAVPKRTSVHSRDHTPNGKTSGDNAEMSPASRYIAMARQGLLGCDSQETPKRVQDLKMDAKTDGEVRTPPLDDALSTPNLVGLSPTTRRRLQAVKRGEMPSDPIKTPVDPFDRGPSTPDSGFGAALRPSGRMSPDARKRLWQVVNELPSKVDQPDNKQTPLSEIRNRFLARFMGDAPTPPSTDHHTAPRKLQLQEQAETPPAKMAKLQADQSAGSKNITEDLSHRDSKSSDASCSLMKNFDSNEITLNTKTISPNSSAKSPEPPKSKHIPVNIDAQLDRLSAALSGRSAQKVKRSRDSVHLVKVAAPESEPGPESQPNTVGWDDTTPAQASAEPPVEKPAIKRFMLSSNVDNREEIMEMIVQLGGEVSDGAEVDPLATHLLCAAPGRSEKMLGSIAAGRWTLHPAYIARSRAVGKLLPEEEYEWGNPLATSLPTLSGSEQTLGRAAHRWRVRRSRGHRGPFDCMVALLHVPLARRKLLARLVEAGGGVAVDDEPPYTNDSITVCFADIKRYPLSDRDKAWLISKRIPVCPPVLLSSYLTDEEPPKPEEHCLPEFRP